MISRTTASSSSRLITSYRSFSSTSSQLSILDYFKFYKKSNPSTELEPKPKPTSEIIQELETKSKPIEFKRRIEIIGQRNPRHTDKEIIRKNLNNFKIHSWIPHNSKYSKKNTTETTYEKEIETLLNSILSNFEIPSHDFKLNNLEQRFKLLKNVQISFGLQIPDLKITQLTTPLEIQKYLIDELNPLKPIYNEHEPNAIRLNNDEFKGSNVSIGEWVFEKQKAQVFRKLIKKSKRLEKESLKEITN
ncbi:hypothetical protein CANARDRAFT_199750 [[Candida] arabinofermentans NRRL YB-2248]|uniref:Large ribosomal subunit protein mL50 n=1 Tax=[Candida] arabinofermentans NRRL YB-2248 TaxID=983967 RepID=A0A1E4SZX3_9ASCO|nr:hypothetical protein CANARDRAFT_199750 [[Candida] arabinofermentans NRRL YB-2248]